MNVAIKALRTDGNWPSRENFLNVMKKSILANDGLFDLILGYQAYMSPVEVMGYLYNFLDVDGIDLDAEYYYHAVKSVVRAQSNKLGTLWLLGGRC